MAEDTATRGVDLTPEVVADLKSLADLLERSLAQAALDHEGVQSHLELAHQRAETTARLITEVRRTAASPPQAQASPAGPVDLAVHVRQADRRISEREQEIWEWSVDGRTSALALSTDERVVTALETMLDLAQVWFPPGGQTTLSSAADGTTSWLHLEHLLGADSPLVVTDGSRKPSASTPEGGAEPRPPGLAALEYIALGLGAQVSYQVVSSERIRLSAGFPQATPPEREPASGLVLLVDDDPDSVFMLEQAVEKAGYTTTKAYDGLTALNKAQSEDVALILLDVMLPGMDGYEVLRRLRADPETANLPIVMVSAKSRPEDIDMGLRLGANQYLTKPLRLAQVVSTVQEQIGKPPDD